MSGSALPRGRSVVTARLRQCPCGIHRMVTRLVPVVSSSNRSKVSRRRRLSARRQHIHADNICCRANVQSSRCCQRAARSSAVHFPSINAGRMAMRNSSSSAPRLSPRGDQRGIAPQSGPSTRSISRGSRSGPYPTCAASKYSTSFTVRRASPSRAPARRGWFRNGASSSGVFRSYRESVRSTVEGPRRRYIVRRSDG